MLDISIRTPSKDRTGTAHQSKRPGHMDKRGWETIILLFYLGTSRTVDRTHVMAPISFNGINFGNQVGINNESIHLLLGKFRKAAT